jgi:hypothetical protein
MNMAFEECSASSHLHVISNYATWFSYKQDYCIFYIYKDTKFRTTCTHPLYMTIHIFSYIEKEVAA